MSSCRGGHMSVKEGLGGSVYEERAIAATSAGRTLWTTY